MHLPEFDACPLHSALQASAIGPISARALDLSYFTRKGKYAFINL